MAALPARAADRVVLQLQWDHQFQFAGYYAAQWQGFYRDAGIEVEIRPALRRDGPLRNPVREINEGRAQFATSNAGVLLALADGAPVVILASIFQQSGTRGYYRADTAVATPADLLKLRIGRNRGNELLDVELRALLAAEGVDASKLDVVPFDPDKLIQGLVDRHYDLVFGYSLTVPWEVKERGYNDLKALRPSDYGIAFYGDALIADARLAKENPDLVRRFREASLRGWQYALENPGPLAERIARELPRTLALKDPLGFNRFQAQGVAELTLYPVVQLGHINPDRWARMRDNLLKAGVISRPFAVEPIIFDPERDRQRQQSRLLLWLVAGFAAAAAALFGALAWSRSLRRAVSTRTAELRESEARYRALIDHSPDSVFVVRVEGDGRLVYEAGNTKVTDISGEPETGMVGREMWSFLHPDARRQNEPHYQRCIAERVPMQFEYTIPRPSGLVTRETTIVPLTDATGKVARIIGSSRDVTERKSNEALLRQAQKMEAVGQLTSGIAHDFNNLLTVIVGGLEAIGRRPDNRPRVEKYLEIALEAAGRAAKLTQQLLAFSRRQTLQPKVVNVNRLIEDFARLMQRAAGEAVEVQTVLTPEAACCKLDPSQFEAAILNLVVNARDAMPNGGKVTIETRRVEPRADEPRTGDAPPPAQVQIAVSDTGAGIPPDVLERVFEPFFTTKEVGKGTGLGLSMVYGFVQQSGGDIRIESEVGIGTRVILSLPESKAAEAALPEADDTDEQRIGTERILLVEDNPGVRTMTSGVLADLGYEVVTAASAREALEVLREDRRIDLLFTDVVMPGGMSGLDLVDEARRLRPAMCILVTSGHVGQADLGRPTMPILHKPYRRHDLARAVRIALDGEREAPRLAAQG
ncbi:MAG TPA: ABC transporter substrate-binding protein [Microvirga sp.]|nr:ABC transporter substrate-binding protein [Microvirga sp.]